MNKLKHIFFLGPTYAQTRLYLVRKISGPMARHLKARFGPGPLTLRPAGSEQTAKKDFPKIKNNYKNYFLEKSQRASSRGYEGTHDLTTTWYFWWAGPIRKWAWTSPIAEATVTPPSWIMDGARTASWLVLPVGATRPLRRGGRREPLERIEHTPSPIPRSSRRDNQSASLFEAPESPRLGRWRRRRRDRRWRRGARVPRSPSSAASGKASAWWTL